MNRKRLVSGLGIVLLCTSLIAYGADPLSLTASASAKNAVAAQGTVANQVAELDRSEARGEVPVAAPAKKSVATAKVTEPREVPPNDECTNAELVTGPYPVTVCGTNVGATVDCPGFLDRDAVWYEITLPYAVNKLVADYCATDFSLSSYSISTIYYTDCNDCTTPVYGRYDWVDCGDGTSNPEIRWLDLPGPGTVLLPVWLSPANDFCIEFNVSEIVTPANDTCENAELVTGPYPVTVCETNEGATVDCPNTFNQKAVWYEIELPYTVNNLETDFCASDFSLSSYQVGTIYLNDCSDCSATVNGSYVWKDCGDGTSNASVKWNELPGPGTVMLPLFINPAHEFCVEIGVTEVAQPSNDLCENAELVTGPYPTTVCGTNQGATLDCPGALDWNAVWYEVDLPYAINTVETDYCPGEVNMQSDTIGIVYTTDCTCGAMVVGNYEWNDCGNYRANPMVWWRDVPGPGSILIPVWISPAHEFCIEFNVRDGDCDVPCPPDGVAESELCGEDTNGGCLMATPAIEPITCGVPVCGTGWAENGTRDTDWYEISVAEPTTLTFTVESEFHTGVMAGLIETVTPGVVGCDQITGSVNPYATAADCETLVVVYNAYPGTYWWFVGPDRFNDMPCGGNNDYVATLTCEPWEVRGSCCNDETGICTDGVLYQECLEPLRFGGKDSLCDDMSPPCGGCPESMIEIEVFTDRYPSETTWEIKDIATGVVVCSGGPYAESYSTYLEYCCVETSNCYEFTMYDQAGDGQSWGGGGYAVRFDGAELCSTLESSWSGFESSCTNLGGGCEAGRCCYSPWPNCVDTTLLDCVSTYGGLWSVGRTCADDPCLNPDAADFEVVAPYTSPLRDTCDDALNRCHPVNQYYDTPEHVYRVTIPHDGIWSFNTCLDTSNITFLAVGTYLCGEDVGYNSWSCNGVAAEVVAYLSAGDYYADVEGYDSCGPYVFDVHEIVACDVECPAEATIEAELCGESINNGCWGWPNAFEPITAGQTICGTIYADNNNSDTDWFEFVATQDDTMTWTVRSNFACNMGLCEQYVPGVPGCSNFTYNFNPSSQTSDCAETSVSFPVVAGGTYYVYIGHQLYNGSPCGTTNDYVATLAGSICGDLDDDMDVDYDDYVIFLDAFGGLVDGNPPQDAECDYDGSGAVGMLDFNAWLTCYRQFVGDPTAGPPQSPYPPMQDIGQPNRTEIRHGVRLLAP
ncbi:MAG: hypothetical protein JXO22_09040 [Phycisphaerae bacterium]|nr:hypothetical protein [Phycisphaerae bacterium]